MFFDEIPSGLPSKRGIEHQINLSSLDSRMNHFKEGEDIRTKLIPNFALKCLMLSFMRSDIYLKPYIESR